MRAGVSPSSARESECRPSGTGSLFTLYPGLTSWANVYRRSAAEIWRILRHHFLHDEFYALRGWTAEAAVPTWCDFERAAKSGRQRSRATAAGKGWGDREGLFVGLD
jgi:hypothetical protein